MGVGRVGFDNQRQTLPSCIPRLTSGLAWCRNPLSLNRWRVDLVVKRATFNDSRIGAELVS